MRAIATALQTIERWGTPRLRVALLVATWTQPQEVLDVLGRQIRWLAEGLRGRGNEVAILGMRTPEERDLEIGIRSTKGVRGVQACALPEVLEAPQVSQLDDEYDIVHDYSVYLLTAACTTPPVATAWLSWDHQPLDQVAELVAVSRRQQHRSPATQWAGMVRPRIAVDDYPFPPYREDYCVLVGPLLPNGLAHVAITDAHTAGYRVVIAVPTGYAVHQAYLTKQIMPQLGPNDELHLDVDQHKRIELIAWARCLLIPAEPFLPADPLAVEALACGTPVVCTHGSTTSEVVRDRVTGLVVGPDLPGPKAIELAGGLAASDCRRRARKWDVSAMGAGYERIYHQVIRRSSSTHRWI